MRMDLVVAAAVAVVAEAWGDRHGLLGSHFRWKNERSGTIER